MLTEKQKEEYRNQGLTEEQIEALDRGGDNNNPPPNDPPMPFSSEVQQALYEANQIRQRAEEDARRSREELDNYRRQNTAPGLTLEPGDPFQNPERFRQALSQDMAQQVAPLNEFMLEFKRKENYQLTKNKIKALNPQASIALAQIEPYLDNAFLTNPNLVPSEANIMAQIQMIVGQVALSQIGTQQNNQNNNNRQTNQNNNQNNNNQNNNNNNQNMLPPHLRPSNRSANNDSPPAFDESQFTENERRLARESRMSLQEYVTMRDCDPHNAEATWKQILVNRKAGK